MTMNALLAAAFFIVVAIAMTLYARSLDPQREARRRALRDALRNRKHWEHWGRQ